MAMEKTLNELLQKAAIWILSGAVTAGSFIIWDHNDRISKHDGIFSGKWNDRLYELVLADLEYPHVHDTYRTLYVIESKEWEKHVEDELDSLRRLQEDCRESLSTRLRQVEKDVAVMKEWRK